MGIPVTTTKDPDSLPSLVIGDFSAGLISQADYTDTPAGACVDCENVLFKPGRMVKRFGYEVKTALAAVADGVAWFYDSTGTRQMCVWANGNLYSISTSTFAPTLVASSVYTAGNRITWTVLARVLYYSDGVTIRTSGADDSGISKYDPVGSPGSSPMVISAGGVGSIKTPAAKVLTVRAGQLLLGGIKYVGGTTARDCIMWSNVLDPTTILGTNIYRVGDGKGGEINSLVNMSVTDQLSYFDGTFCGMTETVHMIRGALTKSTVEVIQLPAATGVLDGATAAFLPVPKSAQVAFLGADRKAYSTNGVEVVEISEQISDELRDWIIDRNTAVASPIFTGARNQKDHHYVLDVGGGRHYCYDWDLKCWTKYNRWVNGYWVEAKDSHANTITYVADLSTARLVEQNVTTTDDGNPIAPFWTSGWLTPKELDGDYNIIWKWLFLSFKTDSGNVMATVRVKQGQGSSASATFKPQATSGGSGSSLWDNAVWDTSVWSGTVTATVTPYKGKKRLYTQLANGERGKLQGQDAQVTLTPTDDGWFEVLNVNLLHLPTGRRHVAT